MSLIMHEAASAYRRWRDMNPEDSAPPVRVVLRSGEEHVLNGIAVHPSFDDRDVVAFSSADGSFPIVVLRDESIDKIEIGVAAKGRIGFHKSV